jgi:hypothetical protein
MEDESNAPDNDSTSIPAPDAVADNIESEDVDGRDESVDNDAQDAAVAANGVDDATRTDVNSEEDTNDTTAADEQSANDVPSNASSDSRKRSKDDVDENEEPLPTLPLKRARTAYFIFADEKRDEVKQQVNEIFSSYEMIFYTTPSFTSNIYTHVVFVSVAPR